MTNQNTRATTKVVVATTVMLSFISFWRAAAIVLNDMASTAYYIGGIAETAIGKAAPWFILAIMLFSYAVRAVYIESCSMFVRGGVYKVVHEAMGGTLAKFSVSALMFDYVLTGPISGVSAGLYLGGLINETAESLHLHGRSRPSALFRGGVRDHRDALFLAEEYHRHPGIEPESAAHHAGHYRDGGDSGHLVPDHDLPERIPARARAGHGQSAFQRRGAGMAQRDPCAFHYR